MEEVWRPVKEFEGYYEVSNYGNVRSVDRWVIRGNGRNYLKRGNIISMHKRNNGYFQVSLNREGTHKNAYVHRLVAQAFLPNPNNLPCVNHKDEDKSNNRASNLEWCTHKYNNNYGEHNTKISKSLSYPVAQYDLSGNLVETFESCHDVERKLGFDNSHISAACLGRAHTAYHYFWRYYTEEPKKCINVKVHNKDLMVGMYSTEGNLIKTYDSLSEAHQHTGLDTSGLSKACRGVLKTCGGYIWKYLE